MSYWIFTDACSNLPNHLLNELDINVLPCSYLMDGVEGVYAGLWMALTSMVITTSCAMAPS